MKESVAIAKEADTKKDISPTKSNKSIHRVQHEPERHLGSLRSVINNIRHDGGTPSVDSIATQLSSMTSTERAPVLTALQQTHGNQYVQRVVTSIQAKLKVGQPGDIYEQEADRVAEQVMRMTEPEVQRQAEEEKKKKEEEGILQTKEISGLTPEVTSELESRIHALKGGGQPLPEFVRAFFEPRFGYDFGEVRVHTDARAAGSAQALNARAYTVGCEVAFGAGQYTPGTTAGKRLLAHELVHVVQQNQDRLAKSDSGAIRAQRNDKQLFIMREEGDEKTAAPKPKINYKSAKRSNTYYAGKNILGWESKLVEVAGGAYKVWADLWKEGKYDEFADAVAAQQVKLGWSGKDVDGVLGLKTWAQIAGLGEAMAGIRRVRWEDSEYVCTQATKERIMRGHKIATGKFLTLPEDKTMNIFNAILQSVPSRMLDVELKYRGTGAAGALAYAGLGEFVPGADIWAGKLKPGAAVQVWGDKDAYDLLRAGEIEEGGKKRRITDADANFYGTSFVFVRYDTESFERMLVRHYGSTEWKSRGSYAVWVAANAKSAEEAKE